MNGVCRDIFRAIHEGKWLTIEYKNKNEEVTKYWIGIKELDIKRRLLNVDGLHLGNLKCKELSIYIDSILSSAVIDGSYQAINKWLVEDISKYPEKYGSIFDNTANLKILNYLADCNKLDCTPYYNRFSLIERLDIDKLSVDKYKLDDTQFRLIIDYFQRRASNEDIKKSSHFIQLGMNVLSIHINQNQSLYVLAYKKVNLDVKNKSLSAEDDITICKEFSVDGNSKMSVRKFLDAEDFYLLDSFDVNAETIKDRITASSGGRHIVDDLPYLIAIGMDSHIDLNYEYSSILNMYENDEVTTPVKAFFGDVTTPSRRRKDYPITLLNRRVNLDQLLAIHNAVKYPAAYIQGPPGTGKTNTIINTITTAFFSERTVLFSSYNNHPIDGVFKSLISIEYKGKEIPFPILRIGNRDVNEEAIEYIKELLNRTKSIVIYDIRKD